MTMYRDIELSHDPLSWKKHSVPSSIALLPSIRRTNIWVGLIHVAKRIRPPVRHGFHLSDLHAWVRYFSAFDSTADLRLRPEWKDIDTHQKMVLSDELGMGLTTQLLAEELGVKNFVDTIHYLKVVNPTAFRYVRRARRGPAKSPDFIGIDTSSRFYVIECKGTQSSRYALRKSMSKGVAQKTNITTSPGSIIHAALVVGLFIPQSISRENALIHIMDPEPNIFERLFRNISRETLEQGMVQISLAKHFALIDHSIFSKKLASTPTIELGSFNPTDQASIADVGETNFHNYTINLFPDNVNEDTDNKLRKLPHKLTIRTPVALIKIIAGARTYHDAFNRIHHTYIERRWETKTDDSSVTLRSPYGIEYTLST